MKATLSQWRVRAPMLGRAALAYTGSRLSDRTLHSLSGTLNYVRTGKWIHEHGFDGAPRFWTRNEVFDVALAHVRDQRVLYLEFGVWKGEATRYWARGLKHPESKLHGFDSFEGLPEAWTGIHGKGHFDTSGKLPAVGDDRVRFFPGWFDETLPSYRWPDGYDRLVAVVDCDLYSSTVEVLDFLEPRLDPGSLLFFDEFNFVVDEQRAFEQFVDRTGMSFRLLASTIELRRVLFERTA